MFPKGIIFDMDGVIFDSESVWKQAFVETNAEFGLDLTEQYRQSTCGKSEKEIREELKLMHPEADAVAYRERLCSRVMSVLEHDGAPLKPGFASAAKSLREHGSQIALATSSSRDRAMLMFAKRGIDPEEVFDAMVFADDVTKAKPDPEIFLKAAGKLSLRPAECAVVEDSVNGIKAAVDGGFIPVMIPDLIVPDDHVLCSGAMVAEDLSGLCDALAISESAYIGIDAGSWARRDAFNAFRHYSNPVVSVSVRLDVTSLCARHKATGSSFFIDFLYILSCRINECPELMLRIVDGEPVRFGRIDPGYVVERSDGAILTCRTRFTRDYETFCRDVSADIDDVKMYRAQPGFNKSRRFGLFFASCIPWTDAVDVSHPYDSADEEMTSVPRMAWARFTEENGRMKMMFNISADHALVDGHPLCRFINSIQSALDDPNFFKAGEIR